MADAPTKKNDWERTTVLAPIKKSSVATDYTPIPTEINHPF
jgi:hypothetical protein